MYWFIEIQNGHDISASYFVVPIKNFIAGIYLFMMF